MQMGLRSQPRPDRTDRAGHAPASSPVQPDHRDRDRRADLLADLDHDDLVALVTKLVHDQPDLYDRVEAAISVPSASGKAKKNKRKKVDPEVYRRQVRDIMHTLDRMRSSEA